MKRIPLILFLAVMITSLNAQPLKLKVWPDGAPENNGLTAPEEQFDGVRVRNVSEAEMFVYLPEKAINTGVAVLICPGGGYQMLAMDHEGFEMAEWLNVRGVAGIVLKYRMPNGHHAIPSSDARRAMRIIRMNAEKWGIHPSKIGIAGSSAGGHLAATVGTRFDAGNASAKELLEQMSSRPDFMLLLYPVITMKEEFTHMGSRNNLTGTEGNPDLIALYSNEEHVSKDTPPTFLVLADDDKAVVPQNSIAFYTALKDNGVPAEMHIFQKGGHGFGMRKSGIAADQWPGMFEAWLKAMQILP